MWFISHGGVLACKCEVQVGSSTWKVAGFPFTFHGFVPNCAIWQIIKMWNTLCCAVVLRMHIGSAERRVLQKKIFLRSCALEQFWLEPHQLCTLFAETSQWCYPQCSEASCVSQIRTAKAVAEDFGQEAAAQKGILHWAKADVTHSEREAHRIIRKQKTTLDVPIRSVKCDGIDVPWIDPQSWLRWWVKNGHWPHLAGCDRGDYTGAERNLTEFWECYKKIDPGFELFHLDGVDFSKTLPMMIHGDEGRTLKKNGMMITSLQSCLGRGYDPKRVRQKTGNLQVNFSGHTFVTRAVVSTVPKTTYDCQPQLFDDMMEQIAKSCSEMFSVGLGGYKVVILGVKGDAPYLSKVARFYRSYNTTAKRGDERGPPKGCCPYCLAGTRLCAAEEIGTSRPAWLATVAMKLPWVRTPSVIKHLMHEPADPAAFFKSDIWHVYHLGFGRSWICSILQLLITHLPLPNLDEKWSFLSDHYLQWCRSNRRQCHVSRITPYLVSYGEATGAMGNWHKGALTANLTAWLVILLEEGPRDSDGLLMKCCAATRRINAMFSVLYRSGLFLGEMECAFVAEQGLQYLSCYQELALQMYRSNRQHLFPLYPKLHVMHHILLEVKSKGTAVKTAMNPMAFSCQMDEDVVGRASRLSRRVNIRKVAYRTLQRYLVAAHGAFVKSGLLV